MKVNSVTGLKSCPKCGVSKESSDFYIDRSTTDQRCCYCKDCVNAVQRVKPKSLESSRVIARRWSLKNKFGLTESAYSSMLAGQLGLCAICTNPESAVGRRKDGQPKSLAVDHDHVTGRVRGLLCDSCNIGISKFGDDPERLEAAVRYLRGAVRSK